MAALAIGQSSDCSNPILDLFTQINGVLVDILELSFQIFDVSDPVKFANPVQIFPATIGQRESVDVVNICPTGDKITTGRFVATFTVPEGTAIGTHRIQWFFKLSATAPEQTFTEEFEVLAVVAPGTADGYAFVSDLRDEGVTVNQASDQRLQRLISLMSDFVDEVTGRRFSPEPLVFDLNARGGRVLLLDQPIIAIDEVIILPDPFVSGGTVVAPDVFRVFNRHLTQRLRRPDDRDNPRIEFIHGRDLLGVRGQPFDLAAGLTTFVWPNGPQTVQVSGVFGYTDFDGTPSGKTPDLIRHVTKLLVLREVPLMTDDESRNEIQNRFRIKRDKTRDQEQEFDKAVGAAMGAITGNAEIDNILIRFSRPPELGAS